RRHIAMHEKSKPMRPRQIPAPPQRAEARMIAADECRREQRAAPPRIPNRRTSDRARIAAEVDEAVRDDALEPRVARDDEPIPVPPLRILPRRILIESPICPRVR